MSKTSEKIMLKLISFLLCLWFSALAVADESATVLGAWKLEKIKYHLEDREVEITPSGGGRWIFTETRYALMYVPMQEPRSPFAILAKPTDQEAIAGFKSVVFNSGSYEWQEDTLVTRADIAKVPGFEGGQQIYTFTHEGGTMILRMIDEIYPDGTKPDWSGKVEVSFFLRKED